MSVGIFWYLNGEIVGFKQTLDTLIPDSLGLIDSDFTHVYDWEKLNRNFGDYEDYPRGRVIFNTKNNTYLIYLDASLLNVETKNKIIKFFGLSERDYEFKFRKDSHYRINDRI